MNKKPLIAIGVVTVLLTAGYFIDRARTQRQSTLSGFFESQPTEAASRIGGRVAEILVNEGDQVEAGQAIVRFETESYEATYQAQKAAEAQAEQQYRLVLEGPRSEQIARARSAVDEAQAAYDRLLAGARPEEVRIAEEQLAQARALYRKAATGSRAEEIQAAQAGANVALARLRQAERGLTNEEKAQLKARLDATAASEELARKELARVEFLYREGAVARQQLDSAKSASEQAEARRAEAEQAYRRAQQGTPKEELAQVREAYRQAAAQLRLVQRGTRREDIEAAAGAMRAAEQNLRLVRKGPRDEDLRAAKARLDQTLASLRELERGSRPEEVARAKAARDQAALQAKSVRENLLERIIKAPDGGIVDRILVAKGDLIAAGSPVVQLSRPADIWLRVYLPEIHLAKVKSGDPAVIEVDGVGEGIEGIVESVAAKGEFTPANLQSPEERGRQVFAVRLRLAKPDARVKAGMYATVRRMGQWP